MAHAHHSSGLPQLPKIRTDILAKAGRIFAASDHLATLGTLLSRLRSVTAFEYDEMERHRVPLAHDKTWSQFLEDLIDTAIDTRSYNVSPSHTAHSTRTKQLTRLYSPK